MNVSKKQVHHIRHTRGPGNVYRCLAAYVGVLQVGPRGQELHNIPVAFPDGNVDRQGAAVVREVYRSSVLHQHLQSVRESGSGRVVDGRYPVFVLDVGVGPFFQQQTGDLGVPHHHHLEEMSEERGRERMGNSTLVCKWQVVTSRISTEITIKCLTLALNVTYKQICKAGPAEQSNK